MTIDEKALDAAAERIFLNRVACMGWEAAKQSALWRDDVEAARRDAADAVRAYGVAVKQRFDFADEQHMAAAYSVFKGELDAEEAADAQQSIADWPSVDTSS